MVGLATGLDVGIEAAAAKDQVWDQRQVRHEHQRQRPGNRALGGAHGQHRVQGGEGTEKMQGGDEVAEQVRAEEIHGQHYS